MNAAAMPASIRKDDPGTTAEPALAVAGVSYAFGKRKALDDVSFTLEAGRFAVLFGLNGAGKTTLFSLLTRLYTTRHGAIRILGHDLARAPGPALARLGVVFQQSTLDLDLTVRQNLEYHAALHGLGRAETRARVAEELERNGLADRAGELARALSGGQRRRVEIARALLHRPDLLLLDEPTVGLDVRSRQDIEAHVRTLCASERLAVLWATHLTDEASPGDRLVVLHQGRLRFDGTVAGALEGRGGDLRGAFMTLIGETSEP